MHIQPCIDIVTFVSTEKKTCTTLYYYKPCMENVRLLPHCSKCVKPCHNHVQTLYEDFGTYPYVTSSNCTAGAVCTGLGIGPKVIKNVLGVSKAYVTRVGGGPFPTEMPPELDEEIRNIGKEYGATTQRPRRCGWLDLVALRYACNINGLTSIALTKLDVFDTLPDIQVCVAYRYKGRVTTAFPSSLKVLEKCEPVYETLPGWQQPLTETRSADDIPQTTKDYVQYVSDYLKVPIPIISVGPDRDQIVQLGDPLW